VVYNEQLFDLSEIDAEAGVIEPGQWRLARVEMVNWGTFCGYQSLPVSRKGLLITGSSGSGKSTLLDAITTVLTPPRSRQLNAAARSASTRGEDRTIYSYIRGAWRHEADEMGEIGSTYLRPQTATWSGILLRYENGIEQPDTTDKRLLAKDEPINLIALFNLKANSNSGDGLGVLYAVARGEQDLKAFEHYAKDGVNIRMFKRDFADAGAYREHSQFASHFCKLMGIKGPKTLELLHKTQAAKNFGSLDDLFRRFMLEQPRTFDQANEAVEQFSALAEAYAGVIDLRRQKDCLEPLVALDASHHKAQAEVSQLLQLAESLRAYSVLLLRGYCQSEYEKKQREADRVTEALIHDESERRQARSAFDQAQASLNESGASLVENARLLTYEYEKQLANIQQNRNKLLSDLSCIGQRDLPRGYQEWEGFKRRVQQLANEAGLAQQANRESDYASYGQVIGIKEQLAAIHTELLHLRSRPTNIPLVLHNIRMALAEELGLQLDDLPFVGELVSVREYQASWHGALERLLGSQAKTLLVCHRHIRGVTAYLESINLGLRLEYVDVAAEVEVPKKTLHEQSTVRKLEVAQHSVHPEFSLWVNRTLRERFDYVCVEALSELDHHPYALTIGGQIKRKNRYVKDDRHDIDDKKHWVLGSNNDAKIELLERQERELREKLEEAEALADSINKQAEATRDLTRVGELLATASWQDYDEKSAQDELGAALSHYELLKKANKEYAPLYAMLEEAREKLEKAEANLRDNRVAEGRLSEDLELLHKEIDDYTSRLDSSKPIEAGSKKQLEDLYKKADRQFNASKDAITNTTVEVQERIFNRREEMQKRVQDTRSKAETLMHDFKQLWPAIVQDYSDVFEDREGYLAIYNRIKANGLPDYEQRFLRVLHDFSQDQITALTSTIRGAFREVKDRLYPVNRSLMLSEYSPGIHLQIEAKDNRSKQVAEFLDDLKAITRDSWDDNDLASAEARYLRTSRIIDRLKSDEYADRVWKNNCLDTRHHVGFIAKEMDGAGEVQGVHGSDVGLSGGQKQKLVIFCLAAALRYQLADEDQLTASYGTVVLDEAFDKADYRFAETALDIFKAFGFHMVLATPLKFIQTLEDYIGAIAMVSCQDSKYSSLQMVAIEEVEPDSEDQMVVAEEVEPASEDSGESL